MDYKYSIELKEKTIKLNKELKEKMEYQLSNDAIDCSYSSIKLTINNKIKGITYNQDGNDYMVSSYTFNNQEEYEEWNYEVPLDDMDWEELY